MNQVRNAPLRPRLSPARLTVAVAFFLFFHYVDVRAQGDSQTERERIYQLYNEFPKYLRQSQIDAHWMPDGKSFWFLDGSGDATTTWSVNATDGTRVELDSLPTPASGSADTQVTLRTIREARLRWIQPNLVEHKSPDNRWLAGVSGGDVYLRTPGTDSLITLTDDAEKDFEYGSLEIVGDATTGQWSWWSQDSSRLAVKKTDYRHVGKMPIVSWTKNREGVEWVPWLNAGDKLPHIELHIIDINARSKIPVHFEDDIACYMDVIGWRRHGTELLLIRIGRSFHTMELVSVDTTSGKTKSLVQEQPQTFVQGLDEAVQDYFAEVDKQHFVWLSERDGWNHLYLYDFEGTCIRQLTKGDFRVAEIIAVDRDRGVVYFTANTDKERPYDVHLCRVNTDGSGFRQLTRAPGQHHISISPTFEFFLDTHSSVDRLPVIDLRKTDGTFVSTVVKTDAQFLRELRWRPPEEFTAKAADGKTDLYGVIYLPYDLDATRKYPVVEFIYGGPQMTYVRRDFLPNFGAQALAQLGFITYVVDARGTPGRSKAFHDVVHGQFGRHEIPDHVAVLKQLVQARPYMDENRVGITGWSWGGYFTIRGMLMEPDVYRVGVAISPTAEAYGDYSAEFYLGHPDDNKPGYDYALNLRLANQLKGRLLIMHGTSDHEVPFSQAMKMVDAFVRAGRPHSLIVLPEQPHQVWHDNNEFIQATMVEYFREYLEP